MPHFTPELTLSLGEVGSAPGDGELGGLVKPPVGGVIGTWVVAALAAAPPAIAVPHDVQNATPVATSVPHLPQKFAASDAEGSAGRAVPQLTQNPAPSGIFVPQDEQFIDVSALMLSPAETKATPPLNPPVGVSAQQ
jgi:hypothetical protein